VNAPASTEAVPRPRRCWLRAAVDGPRTTNKDFTPEVRIPCGTSNPRRICASRPKNTAAVRSSGGGHRQRVRLIP
jgi:hypothetical protein